MLESDMELGMVRPRSCGGGGGRKSGQPPAAKSPLSSPACPKLARRIDASLFVDWDSTSCASSIILSSFSIALVCLAARKALRAAFDMEWGLWNKRHNHIQFPRISPYVKFLTWLVRNWNDAVVVNAMIWML